MNKFIIENFYERYVQILTDATLHMHTEDGTYQDNLKFEGYLVKFDDKFLYLGNENNEILHAIQIKFVVTITDILMHSQEEDYKACADIDPSEMN